MTHHHHYVHRHAPHRGKLYVVSALSNPQRYQSRYRLHATWRQHMHATGVIPVTAELALGDRPFEHEEPSPLDLQFRSWDELWHKENLINLAVQRLPSDWQYVAWVDGDVEFLRADWADEACHMLQHHMIIQLFENAIDMGPNGEAFATHTSFASAFEKGTLRRDAVQRARYGFPFHPGFAWAARREAFEMLGGLLDVGILGSSDHHMAWALAGDALATAPKTIASGYKRRVLEWQDRATRHIRGDLGYMRGTILHHWHGKKRDRRYADRWDILINHGFDPDKDLKRDWQGLWQFTSRGERMRNDIRAYFRSRTEDSIDV